jgi:hypothetical protein
VSSPRDRIPQVICLRCIPIHVIQAEYLLAKFPLFTNQQNNVRISAGVVFRF